MERDTLMPLRIAIANYAWDTLHPTPDAALDRFETLTGWAEALRDAGAEVVVFQRFHTTTRGERRGIPYEFVRASGRANPRLWQRRADAMHRAIAAPQPDVVHVNGAFDPELVRGLRRAVPLHTAIVVQDHGGFDIREASPVVRWWMKRGLTAADTLFIASGAEGDEWRARRALPDATRIGAVMEAGTRLEPGDRTAARIASGTTGHPALLWVGRLNGNKDPLTALAGVNLFLANERVRGSRWYTPKARTRPRCAR